MNRYDVIQLNGDKGYAIHDTLTNQYAPFVTEGRATEDANLLNVGAIGRHELLWTSKADLKLIRWL